MKAPFVSEREVALSQIRMEKFRMELVEDGRPPKSRVVGWLFQIQTGPLGCKEGCSPPPKLPSSQFNSIYRHFGESQIRIIWMREGTCCLGLSLNPDKAVNRTGEGAVNL